MRSASLISTGISWLDQLLGQLRIGENVVWEVGAGTDVDVFMRAFLETEIKGDTRAVYISFNHSPVTMKEKLGELFDEPSFILWTVSLTARGAATGIRPLLRHGSRPGPGARGARGRAGERGELRRRHQPDRG